MTNDYLTIKEASKYLRVSKDTLRRWEKKKILKPFRSPTGWRYYSKRQLDYVFIQKPDFNEGKTFTIIKNVQLKPEQKLSNLQVKDISTKDTLTKSKSKFKKVIIILLTFFISFGLILLGFYIYQIYFLQ